jgi:MHS family proline/betaine transporter-like MFS transporter
MKYLNKAVFGSLIGNIMEFYDFVIYGYLSIYLGQHFFPSNNKTISLLVTFSVFAGGYFIRPLGSIIFGYIGDIKGRKPALLYSISLMSFSTLFMGFIPTYHQVGIIAPIILIILRLLQGLAVSGEQGGAIVYLAEYFKMQKIGVISALMFASVLTGVLLGSLSVVVCQTMLSENEMIVWGWRIPFYFSAILGFFSLKLRWDSIESPTFKFSHQAVKQLPIINLAKENFNSCVRMFLLSITFSVAISFHNTYLPIFYSKIPELGANKGMIVSSVGIFWIGLLSPLVGILSEKIGYIKTVQVGCLLLFVLGYQLFCLLQHQSIGAIILVEIIFGIIIALISAPMFAIFVQNFPTQSRCTGVSLTYNLGMSVFASLTPIIAILLFQSTNMQYLIGVLLSLSALGGLISLDPLCGVKLRSKVFNWSKI